MFMHLHFRAISFIHSYHGLSLQHCCLSVSQAWPCSYFLYFFKGQSQTTPTPPSSGLLVTRIPPGSPCDTCYRYEPGLMSPAPRSPWSLSLRSQDPHFYHWLLAPSCSVAQPSVSAERRTCRVLVSSARPSIALWQSKCYTYLKFGNGDNGLLHFSGLEAKIYFYE